MSERPRETWQVDAHGAHQRLDRYLAQLGRWGTRARVQRLIEAGAIEVEGKVGKPGTMLRPGQTIVIDGARIPEPAPAGAARPEPIPLDVLFEDAWILVLNKPPGLVVHPAPGHGAGTLVNALLHHWDAVHPELDPARPGIVHRLDKDTSGVLVIARDPDTLAALGRQFHDRTVRKQYLAAVWGCPTPRRGRIDAPIGRHPVHRQRMSVRSGGRAAVTSYRVIRTGPGMSWLRLFPETGRTHQIRVHLASLGHPIVGDATYGRTPPGYESETVSRQALHAESLTFRHPHSGQEVSFTAPLAADLQPLWDRCEPVAARPSSAPRDTRE